MNTLVHPPLRLLERRPPRRRAAPLETPAPRPTWSQRFEAWLDRLPMPRHHRMGHWTAMR